MKDLCIIFFFFKKSVKNYPACKQLKGMLLVLKVNKVDDAILLINKPVHKRAIKISNLHFSVISMATELTSELLEVLYQYIYPCGVCGSPHIIFPH